MYVFRVFYENWVVPDRLPCDETNWFSDEMLDNFGDYSFNREWVFNPLNFVQLLKRLAIDFAAVAPIPTADATVGAIGLATSPIA